MRDVRAVEMRLLPKMKQEHAVPKFPRLTFLGNFGTLPLSLVSVTIGRSMC
jgi:hypothetical protein